MLGIHCPECKAPLFQDPKTGTVSCPICGTEFEVVEEEKAKKARKKVEERARERKKRTESEGEKKKTKREEKEPDRGGEKQKRGKEKQKRRPRPSVGEDVREAALRVVTARLERAAEAKDPEHALRELEVAEKALEILKKL